MALNEQLYKNLCRKFNHAGGVQMANEGLANVWRVTTVEGRKRRELEDHGEQYRVCCPWCNDTRHRLYVNYEFGTMDPDGRVVLFPIQCFNEACMSSNSDLREIFFHEVMFGRPLNRVFLKPPTVDARPEYVDPGELVSLDRLDRTHPAIEYLKGRGLSVNKLTYLYNLKWCAFSKLSMTRARIIIPYIFEGKEVGWTARLPTDERLHGPDGREIPKYFNMPGFKKEKFLYNFDRAKKYKTIILVEGAFDAIVVGAPAMALCGSSLGVRNCDRLVSLVTRTGADIVVALDPDKPIADRHSKHHLDIVVDKLTEKLKGKKNKVLPLWLPPGTDPGSTPSKVFRQLARDAAAEHEVTLDFSTIEERKLS